MAKDIKIGIKIAADGKEFTGVAKLSRKELNQISKSADRTNKKVKGLGQSFGIYKKALVVGAAVAFTHQLNSQADALDRIGKTADKVGLTTDELQELRFAGTQAGVAVNVTDLALQRFSRRLGEAARGSGELRGTLEEYNIAVVDSEGKTRRNIDVLGDLANVIKGAESEQERLRIAFKGFDSEGAALVNLLKKGKAGLDDYARAAHDSSQVVNEESIRSAEAYADSIGKLTGSLTTLWQEGLAPVLPLLTEFVDALNGDVGTRELEDKAGDLRDQVVQLDRELAKTRVLRINPFASDADIQKDKQALLDELDFVKRQIFTFNLKNQKPGQSTTVAAPTVDAKSLAALERLDAQLKQQISVFGQGQDAVLRYRLTLGDLADEVLKAGDNGEQLKQSIIQRAAALDGLTKKQEASKKLLAKQNKLQAEGAALTQSLLTPQEQLIATEAKLNTLRKQGVISQQTLNRAVAQAHEVFQDSNQDLADARSIYESTLTPLEQYNQKVARLNELFSAGAFDGVGGLETYRRGVEQAKQEFDRLNESQLETVEFAQEAARNIQDSFADFLFDPFEQGLDGMARGLADTLRRMAANALAAQLNVALLGGDFEKTGQVGGFIGDLLGGGQSASSSSSGIGGAATIAAQTTALVTAEQVSTAQIVAAISGASVGGAVGGGNGSGGLLSSIASFLPKFHSGGVSPKEQLAVLLKDEEVLTRDNPRHKDNAGNQASSGTRIINVIDPALVKDYMSSSSGEKVIMNIIQRNAGQVKQVLT